MEPNSISVIESGRNFPTLMTLEKIANALNVELAEFFQYEHFSNTEYLKEIIIKELEKMNNHQIIKIFKFIKYIM